MKGTEKIIAHIQADAQTQVKEILAKAEQQCAEIRADYAAQAEAVYADRIRAGVKVCQDKVDSQIRIAQMEAKKSVLAVKQDMVAQSFDLAREKLISLPEDAYVAFLGKLAAEAAVSGEEEIILNVRDRAAIGEKVVAAANARLPEGKLRLSDETGSFAGGLILRRGNVEANCTAELLVELCQRDMSAQLAGVLFE